MAGFAVAACPSPAGAATGQRVGLGLGIASLYDDNILEYSDAQLLLLESGLKPEQFSIETRDDLLLEPYAAVSWSDVASGGRARTVRLRWGGEFHKENRTADAHSYSASWSESFSRGRRLTLYGYWLPHFYLRQLFDEDAGPSGPGISQYRRAELNLALGSVAWRQELGAALRGTIGYRFEHRGYNPDFEERTSSTHEGEVGLEARKLPAQGKLAIYGAYRWSEAKAVDSDSMPNEADVSYSGPLAGVQWRMQLARRQWWRLSADLGYELGTRAYSSDRPADRYHFRRKDLSHSIELTLRWAVPPRWAVRGLYRFATNTADLGTFAPPGSEAGSYTANQIGLALDWTGTLWRGSSGPATEEGD